MAYSSSDAPATDFAITTVNVPDRLDMRDMDDRKQLEDDYRQRGIDPAVIRTWLPRVTLVGLLAIIVFLLWQVVDTWRNSLAAEPLSNRLTASLGMPVRIESSQFALFPSPRLVLTKVTLQQDLVLNNVALKLTTRHIAQFFQGRGFTWGEAIVGPSSITLAQAHDLMQLLPRLNGAFSTGIGMVRFDDLQIAEQDWLKGSWRVNIERGNGPNAFAAAVATQNPGSGSIQVQLTSESPEVVNFDLKAFHWNLPFGFKAPVDTAQANGKISYAQLQLDQFSVSGNFGEIHGSVSGFSENGWHVDGNVASDGLDVDGLIKQLAPGQKKAESEGDNPAFAQGMATFSGRLEGKGANLQEAVDTAQLVAPVNVRSAVLNGINLGFIAMNPTATPEASGGSTRFSTLDAVLVANSKQTTIRNLHARAGALLALGEVDVNAAHEISGVVHVDLGTTRVLAPIRVRVHGTLDQPKFGR